MILYIYINKCIFLEESFSIEKEENNFSIINIIWF